MQLNKDRAYTIQINNKNQEVTLASRVISGLLWLNEPNRRENTEYDKTFIKALLIGICTLKTIQNLSENQRIPKGVLAFIKGKQVNINFIYKLKFHIFMNIFVDLFINRIGDENGTRYLKYNDLVIEACNDIKVGKFK